MGMDSGPDWSVCASGGKMPEGEVSATRLFNAIIINSLSDSKASGICGRRIALEAPEARVAVVTSVGPDQGQPQKYALDNPSAGGTAD